MLKTFLYFIRNYYIIFSKVFFDIRKFSSSQKEYAELEIREWEKGADNKLKFLDLTSQKPVKLLTSTLLLSKL